MDHDEEWATVERAKAGDRAAFATLLDRHLDAVRAFLARLGVPPSDRDDAAQETFVTIVRQLDRFRGDSAFRTWALGIALRVAHGFRRRAAREMPRGDLGLDAADPDPQGGDADLAARLERLLARLPPPLRDAFVLRHVEELSVRDAALAAGVPEGTLKRRVFEARERLRSWLAGVELPS